MVFDVMGMMMGMVWIGLFDSGAWIVGLNGGFGLRVGGEGG